MKDYDFQKCVKNIDLTDQEIYIISDLLRKDIKEFKFLIQNVPSSLDLAGRLMEERENILEKLNV